MGADMRDRGQSRKASLGFRLEGNSDAWSRLRWRMEQDPAVTEDR